MSDTIIGHMTIYGEPAKRLFSRQTSGDSVSLRVKGVITTTVIPGRPLYVNNNNNGMYNTIQQDAQITIEIEEVTS